MTKTDVNVLMIGCSGSGKSSLLNYLYGQEIEKTGSGRPVTSQGVFEHSIDLNSNYRLHISDTWGLEPDKSEEWQEMINKEIKKHDVEDIKDWFHVILYCINAKSARIEDFEKEFITSLIAMENHIIIALTHCDNVNGEISDNMTNYLNKIGIDKNNIIKVCSVENNLIGGENIHRFGKDKLLDRIQKNFWNSICDKIPKIIYNKSAELLDEVTNQLKSYVNEKIHFFNIHSNKNYKIINKYCNESYRQCISKITEFSEKKMNESIEYYFAVCDTLFLGTLEEKNKYENKLSCNISYSMMDISEKIAENMASVIMSLIPFVNFLLPKLVTEIKRDEYKKYLDDAYDSLLKQCCEMCRDLSDYLNSLYL